MKISMDLSFASLALLVFVTVASCAPSQRHIRSEGDDATRRLSRTRVGRAIMKKWDNPCLLMESSGAGGQSHRDYVRSMTSNPSFSFSESDSPSTSVLLRNIIRQTDKARRNAQHVEEYFVNSTFGDTDFEESTRLFSQSWLPSIPRLSHSALRGMSVENALRISFEYMQYFAVGVEQVLLDHVLHSGDSSASSGSNDGQGSSRGHTNHHLRALFRELETDLYGLMCELQLAMHLRRVQPRDNITSDVMSPRYRDIPEASLRNFRDFLILRGYISAIDFVSQVSAYFISPMSSPPMDK